jgi:hypothetical protein
MKQLELTEEETNMVLDARVEQRIGKEKLAAFMAFVDKCAAEDQHELDTTGTISRK